MSQQPQQPFDFDVLNDPSPRHRHAPHSQQGQTVVHHHHYHEQKKGWYQGPAGSVVRILIVLGLVLVILVCLI